MSAAQLARANEDCTPCLAAPELTGPVCNEQTRRAPKHESENNGSAGGCGRGCNIVCQVDANLSRHGELGSETYLIGSN